MSQHANFSGDNFASLNFSVTQGRSLTNKYHILDSRRWVLTITQKEPDKDSHEWVSEMIASYWPLEGIDPEKRFVYFGIDWYDEGLGDYQVHCLPVQERIPVPRREAIGSRLQEFTDTVWIHVWSRSSAGTDTLIQQGNMVRKIQEILHLYQTAFPETYGYERIRKTDTRKIPNPTANEQIFHHVITAEIKYTMQWLD